MKWLVIVLLLVVGCSVCQHERTFRRCIKRRGVGTQMFELCKDCNATIVSMSFLHPWTGPSYIPNEDDELVIIGEQE